MLSAAPIRLSCLPLQIKNASRLTPLCSEVLSCVQSLFWTLTYPLVCFSTIVIGTPERTWPARRSFPIPRGLQTFHTSLGHASGRGKLLCPITRCRPTGPAFRKPCAQICATSRGGRIWLILSGCMFYAIALQLSFFILRLTGSLAPCCSPTLLSGLVLMLSEDTISTCPMMIQVLFRQIGGLALVASNRGQHQGPRPKNPGTAAS